MLQYNSENKRVITDTTNKGFVSIPTENTENKRIKLILSDDDLPPIEGLFLKDEGEGQYGIYSIYGGEVPELIPEGTEIKGVFKDVDGEYYVNESEVVR